VARHKGCAALAQGGAFDFTNHKLRCLSIFLTTTSSSIELMTLTNGQGYSIENESNLIKLHPTPSEFALYNDC
jgi:hypothetical protein